MTENLYGARRSTILLLTGPPGAGKTTVARMLAARAERGVHLETDCNSSDRSRIIDPAIADRSWERGIRRP